MSRDEQREYERYRSLKIAANFCEHAYEADGFWTLFRSFRGVAFPSYPAIMRPMDLFIIITDAAGIAPREITATLIDAELMNVEGSDPLMWKGTEQLFSQRYRWCLTALLHLPAVALRRPGKYDLHIEIDGLLLELASLDAVIGR